MAAIMRATKFPFFYLKNRNNQPRVRERDVWCRMLHRKTDGGARARSPPAGVATTPYLSFTVSKFDWKPLSVCLSGGLHLFYETSSKWDIERIRAVHSFIHSPPSFWMRGRAGEEEEEKSSAALFSPAKEEVEEQEEMGSRVYFWNALFITLF